MKTQDYQYIIEKMPYGKSFLFLDKILSIDETHILSEYHIPKHSIIYEGHFKDYAVVPGVILIEIMAQSGLVAQSIYLTKDDTNRKFLPLFSLINTEFHQICLPDTHLTLKSEVIYYRYNVLKAKISLYKTEDMSLIATSIGSLNVKII